MIAAYIHSQIQKYLKSTLNYPSVIIMHTLQFNDLVNEVKLMFDDNEFTPSLKFGNIDIIRTDDIGRYEIRIY